MVHSAYDLAELVKGCNAKIESFASYGSKILVGCSDGSLRIYAPASSLSTTAVLSGGDDATPPFDSDIRREPYAQERAMPGFWKRAPVAMEVCRSRELLLSLSEWIAFHRLPNLETVVAIAKTKGANVYSWDDRRGCLCVGRQKKVGIYRLDGGREFVEVKEFGVPDVVKSMAWCGENICLGTGKEYIILNSTTGASSKVFSSGRSPPLVVPLPSGELILGKHCQGREDHDETIFLGVNLMDRFLSRGYFQTTRNLQLLGIACVTLAARIEENQPFNNVRKKYFKVGKNSYKRCEVVSMEWLVLEVLSFQCSLPTTHSFLWFYMKAARAGPDLQDLCRHLAILTLFNHGILRFWPSTVAAAVVILACLVTNNVSFCCVVLEIHLRSKTDDLPECIMCLEWLVEHAKLRSGNGS